MIRSSLELLPFYEAPSSWWEHVPIAHWLVEQLQPRVIIELGTHYGVSFFSFCEAAMLLSPESFIYSVDTWEGDKHAGQYDETVYEQVVTHQKAHHMKRSRIIRSTFDEAALHFPDCSADLIHIDGLHTYTAVRHDYNTWVSKLRPHGSFLFHDWNVRELDFGVWKFWQEIKDSGLFQCIEIPNGHGLAIATLCDCRPDWHQRLLDILPVLIPKGILLDQLSTLRADNKLLGTQLVESQQQTLICEQKILVHEQQILVHEQQILDHEQQILDHEQQILDHEQLERENVIAAESQNELIINLHHRISVLEESLVNVQRRLIVRLLRRLGCKI